MTMHFQIIRLHPSTHPSFFHSSFPPLFLPSVTPPFQSYFLSLFIFPSIHPCPFLRGHADCPLVSIARVHGLAHQVLSIQHVTLEGKGFSGRITDVSVCASVKVSFILRTIPLQNSSASFFFGLSVIAQS